MGLFRKKDIIDDFETFGKTTEAKVESKKSSLKEHLKAEGKKFLKFIAPPSTPEQIAFNKDLKAQTSQARNKEFLKESVKQAKLKAQRDAKARFNPDNKSSPLGQVGNFGNLGNFGQSNQTPTNKEILKKKLKQSDDFNKLLFG